MPVEPALPANFSDNDFPISRRLSRVRAEFPGCVYHGLDVRELCLVNAEDTGGKHVAAPFAAVFDELATIRLDVLGLTGHHERGRHVAHDAAPAAQHPLSPRHVRLVEEPRDCPLGKLVDLVESSVEAAFREEEYRDAFLYQGCNHFFQRRPVEGIELCIGHPPVRPLVEGKDGPEALGRVEGGHGRLYGQIGHYVHGLEQLLGPSVHVHHDSFRAPQGVAEGVERGLAKDASRSRKGSRTQSPGRERQDLFGPLRELLARVDKRLKARLHVGSRERQQLHRRLFNDVGKGGERAERLEGPENPGHEDPHPEIGRVLDEGVILVGHHVLAFDELHACGARRQTVARVGIEPVIEEVVGPGRGHHRRVWQSCRAPRCTRR